MTWQMLLPIPSHEGPFRTSPLTSCLMPFLKRHQSLTMRYLTATCHASSGWCLKMYLLPHPSPAQYPQQRPPPSPCLVPPSPSLCPSPLATERTKLMMSASTQQTASWTPHQWVATRQTAQSHHWLMRGRRKRVWLLIGWVTGRGSICHSPYKASELRGHTRRTRACPACIVRG